MEAEAKNERNFFLDIIKAICILFVIVTHDEISDKTRLIALFPFIVDMAVPFFMIISGYVYASSFERNKITHISEAYTLQFLLPKFIRYTVPFVMAFTVELFGLIFISHNSVIQCILIFFQGGTGPGSYYYPIMLQFLLFYPVLHFIIRRCAFRGLFLCLVMTAAFEFFKMAWGCGAGFYRMLLFRYTFVIAFGSWLYQCKDEKISNWWRIVSFVVGLAFIVSYRYLKVEPRVITEWTGTSFIACLYLLPISGFLIKKVHIRCKPIECIGKASFNIFLVQMVYFAFAAAFVRKVTGVHILWLLAHIVICMTIGIIFYFVEQPITKKILRVARTKSFLGGRSK